MFEYPVLFLTLITTIILSVMFCMALILYLRWGSRNYQYLTIATSAALVVNTIYSFLASLQVGSILQEWLSMLSTGMYLLVLASFFYLFVPKITNVFIGFIVGAAVEIFLLLIFIFMKESIFVVLNPILVILYLCLFIYLVTPNLPKEKLFISASGIYILGLLCKTLYPIVDQAYLLNIHLLCASISYFLLFFILFDRIVDYMQAASYSSVTDGLTGLFSKHYFILKVKESMLSQSNITVLFIDIDNFKKLNDTEGHQAGDEILKLTAHILKDICEEIGFAGRYGGEEMIALITDPRSEPSVIAERFRDRVENESKALHPITASVGYRIIDEDILEAEDLIKQADEAMYIAKNTGKNKVVNYDDRYSDGDPKPSKLKNLVDEDTVEIKSTESVGTIKQLSELSNPVNEAPSEKHDTVKLNIPVIDELKEKIELHESDQSKTHKIISEIDDKKTELLKSTHESRVIDSKHVLQPSRSWERVDERSLKDQDGDRVPTIHKVASHHMDNPGINIENGDINRTIEEVNLLKNDLQEANDSLKNIQDSNTVQDVKDPIKQETDKLIEMNLFSEIKRNKEDSNPKKISKNPFSKND